MILRSIDLASAQRYCTPHLQMRKLRRLCLVQATNLIDYLEAVIYKYVALFNHTFNFVIPDLIRDPGMTLAVKKSLKNYFKCWTPHQVRGDNNAYKWKIMGAKGL